MTGRYRRAIALSAEPGLATAEIEDDFHHFAVRVAHDGAHVTGVRGHAIRHPWTSCALAAGALEALGGLAISTDPTAVYRHADPLDQCTHMFEMAGLAVTQAARGPGGRRYEAAVTDRVGGRLEAELQCDGAVVLTWALRDDVIVDPLAHRGRRMSDFSSRRLVGLPHDEAEQVLILRRAVALAGSRQMDIDRYPTAAALGPRRACYVFRPGVAETAMRRYGSVRDFSRGPGPLALP